MLPISSTLLNRVKDKLQTIGNNANPQMEIIAQKAAKYLNQGSFLMPRTVRTGNSLGPLDICIRRENKNEEPTEIIMLYIENGIAKVATLPYVSKPTQNFEYKYSIGPASEVACDFDGRWQEINDRTGIYFDTSIRWALVTFSEPYFALINNGALSIQQEQGISLVLADSGVINCVLLRGWKSAIDTLIDQGLICAYIKADGKAYYRNYCEQLNGGYIWELEKEITEFGSVVTSISLFRTADYRTGFLATVNGTMQMLISHRAWSGMAILPESICASKISLSVTFTKINRIDIFIPDHFITAIPKINSSLLYALSDNTIENIYNLNRDDGDYGYKIRITLQHSITSISKVDFLLKDSTLVGFAVTDIIVIDFRTFELICANFNNANDKLTLSFVGTTGTTKGEIGQSMDAFSKSFVPTNLVRYYIPPPQVINIYNAE